MQKNLFLLNFYCLNRCSWGFSSNAAYVTKSICSHVWHWPFSSSLKDRFLMVFEPSDLSRYETWLSHPFVRRLHIVGDGSYSRAGQMHDIQWMMIVAMCVFRDIGWRCPLSCRINLQHGCGHHTRTQTLWSDIQLLEENRIDLIERHNVIVASIQA